MHPYPHFHKLMLVTNRGNTPVEQYLRFVRICLKAGVTSLQLREKETSYSFQLEFGGKLRDLCKIFNVPLIVNDMPRLAADLDAGGVHLGQGDGSPEEAHRLLGKGKIIGLSIEAMDQLEIANSMPFISYVTASAVFPTPSKTMEAQTFWGLPGVKQLAEKSLHTLTAIGGIDIGNAEKVMLAGAKGLAVIGAVHGAEDPAEAVRTLRLITG